MKEKIKKYISNFDFKVLILAVISFLVYLSFALTLCKNEANKEKLEGTKFNCKFIEIQETIEGDHVLLDCISF